MYKSVKQEGRWLQNQVSTSQNQKTELRIARFEKKEATHQWITTSAWTFAGRVVRLISWIAAAWAWAFSAELVRVVGGGRKSQQRHEFESVELRRGGFGDVF